MSIQYPPDVAAAIRAAVEKQIGMLTCQVIELNAQLQMAQTEIARLTFTINSMSEQSAGNRTGGLAD